MEESIVTALAVHPTNSEVVMVGTYDKGLFKTTDGGNNWRNVLALAHINFIAFDRISPSTIYTGTSDGNLLKSTDGGDKFQIIRKGGPEFNSLSIDECPLHYLYGGTTEGIYKSTDGGKTWIPSGLPKLNILVTSINNKEVKPIIYASALDAGVFRSQTNGLTWGNCGEGLVNSNTTSILVDKKIPYLLFVGTLESGLFKSTNNGDSWVPCIKGLGTLNWINLIQSVNPKTMRTIQWATGHENLIFKSENLGEDWTLLDSIPTSVSIYCIATADVYPAPIWIGTNKGLFKIIETQVTDTTTAPTKVPGKKGK
jgi:photosystem II stability/assembly factor-like uncharacterized protein